MRNDDDGNSHLSVDEDVKEEVEHNKDEDEHEHNIDNEEEKIPMCQNDVMPVEDQDFLEQTLHMPLDFNDNAPESQFIRTNNFDLYEAVPQSPLYKSTPKRRMSSRVKLVPQRLAYY